MRKQVLIIGMLLNISGAWAQGVQLNGRFMKDSTQIGVPTPYVLCLLYDPSRDIRSIDSTYQLLPFEWEHMEYFPTQRRGQQYYDSIIYYISTFELDPVQYLSIPVIEITSQGDTVLHHTAVDSIYITGLYGEQASNTPLQAQVDYQAVDYAFDIQLFLIWTASILAVVVALFFLLRKPIRRAWGLHQLKRSYNCFEQALLGVLNRLGSGESVQLLEEGVQIWKTYAEQTSGKAYTKFTTREVIQQDPNMSTILHPLDRIVYRGDQANEARDLLNQLRQVGRLAYEKQKIKLHDR